ncbi:hypothetical protein [Halorubrum sp. CSM-61]|uniref:hypothetical protein n=1 Tax=Halorubrum sp. CSM-61 TaxID=2485838 RepID=UPI000F4C6BD7|nr:hypothetical protein [Halorubrum sp. CSM-61]
MDDDDPFLRLIDDSVKGVRDKIPSLDRSKSSPVSRCGSLEELIDDEAYESPYVGPVEGDAEAEIRKIDGTVRLVVDPAKIDYERRVAMNDKMNDFLEEANGFALSPVSGIAEAVKGKSGKERVNKIVGFYKGKIPPRFRQPLIQGMALRVAEDNNPMEQWEVRKRKRQTAKAHEKRGHSRPEAYNIASLCSSGYFDTNRLFQQLYHNQVELNGWSDAEYADAFEELVCNKPFVVFVEAGTSYKEIYDQMLGKSLNIDEYLAPLEYIDIRGKGDRARRTVHDVKEYINEYHNAKIKMEYENGQSLLRVWHKTL